MSIPNKNIFSSVKEKKKFDPFLLFGLCMLILIMNIPLIKLSFQHDEIDILYKITNVDNFYDFVNFMMSHHNEHLSYTTYIIYFTLYKIFGFNIIPFFILGFLIHCCSTIIIFLLIKKMFDSNITAWIGCSIFGLSNVSLLMQWKLVSLQLGICNFLFLLVLYLFYSYYTSEETSNKILKSFYLFGLSVLLLGTFGSSLLVFFIIPLFYFLVLKERSDHGNKFYLQIILVGSIIGFLLWFVKDSGGIYAAHYQSFNKSSVFDEFSFINGVVNSIIASGRLSLKIFYPALSILIIVVSISILIKDFKKIDLKRILFFLIYIFSSFFIVLSVRHDWEKSFTWSRYYLIPAGGYALLLTSILYFYLREISQKKKLYITLFFIIILLLQISLSYFQNEKISEEYFAKNLNSLEKLKHEYEVLSLDYIGPLEIKDNSLQITRSNNVIEFSKYIKIISKDKTKIKWTDKTSPELINFLVNNKSKYPTFSILVGIN